MKYQISIQTKFRTELIDITHHILEKIKKNPIKDGLCIIYVPHTTAGIIINENADPDVIYDIQNTLDKLIPWKGNYAHCEGNSAAHIKASIVGTSQTLLIEEGNLLLGKWQGIFFAEFDGPRMRNIIIKIIKT